MNSQSSARFGSQAVFALLCSLVSVAQATTRVPAKSSDTIICTQSTGLQVRDADLLPAFPAERGQKVVVDKAAGTKTRNHNGEKIRYIHVDFPGNDDDVNDGWVAESYVKVKSACEFEPDRTTSDQADGPAPTPTPAATPRPTQPVPTPPPRPVDPALLARPRNCTIVRGKPTFYNPIHTSVEGGPRNRHGDLITTVEKAAKKGWPITIAADHTGAFAAHCNSQSPDRRCVILVRAPMFDEIFPQYRRKFPNLPKDSFIGIIEDAGAGSFFSSGSNRAGRHIDIATDRRALGIKGYPDFVTMSWVELASRCGQGAGARECDFSPLKLDVKPDNSSCWPK